MIHLVATRRVRVNVMKESNKAKMRTYKQKVLSLEYKVEALDKKLQEESQVAAEFINSLSNGQADKESIKRLALLEEHIESLYQIITSDQYSEMVKWGLMKSFIFERRAETEIRKVYS